MMVGRATLVTGAAVLSMAAPAVAYPGERPAGDPWLLAMRDAAAVDWDSQGVPGCIPEIRLADDLADVDHPAPDGRGGNCVVYVRASFAGTWLGRARRPYRRETRYVARGVQRYALRYLYRLVLHEVGHARGLAHTDDGSIMDPDCGRVRVGARIARTLVR